MRKNKKIPQRLIGKSCKQKKINNYSNARLDTTYLAMLAQSPFFTQHTIIGQS